MPTNDLPKITTDEVEDRTDAYVESSMEGIRPEVLKQQGITADQLKFAFRQSFYGFITSHFVVIPPKNHDPQP